MAVKTSLLLKTIFVSNDWEEGLCVWIVKKKDTIFWISQWFLWLKDVYKSEVLKNVEEEIHWDSGDQYASEQSMTKSLSTRWMTVKKICVIN